MPIQMKIDIWNRHQRKLKFWSDIIIHGAKVNVLFFKKKEFVQIGEQIGNSQGIIQMIITTN